VNDDSFSESSFSEGAGGQQMFQEYAQARERELQVLARTIQHREAWYQLQAVDRLERALRRAQGRLATAFAQRPAAVR